MPQLFADSTGREFVLINHYLVSLTGQAFVGQYVDYIGDADKDIPKFDFEMDTERGFIGTRNFDEDDYVAVEKMLGGYTSGEYEEVPLDEQGREIEECS